MPQAIHVVCTACGFYIIPMEKVHLITFSPTHTSLKVGEAIVRGIGCPETRITDLTLRSDESLETISPHTLAVFTVPVYGGHVAPLALERMTKLRSEGSPAVIAVVYGNRAYERALSELARFVSERGFRVIAGGTFIGEHSYSNARYPISAGRPNETDLNVAESFGKKISDKIAEASNTGELKTVDVARIKSPRQAIFPLLRFICQVIRLRKSGRPLPRTPQTNPELCTHCGLCVRHCPVGAIQKGNECDTDAEKCIKCCACVKQCPQKARSYDTPFAALLSRNFKKQKENQVIL